VPLTGRGGSSPPSDTGLPAETASGSLWGRRLAVAVSPRPPMSKALGAAESEGDSTLALSRREFCGRAALLGLFAFVGSGSAMHRYSAASGHRSFSASSIWNRVLPSRGSRHPDSAEFIAWMKAHLTNDYLALEDDDWALPVFWSLESDPIVTITPRIGPTTTFRLPAEAAGMAGNDAALLVMDRTTSQDVQLFEFTRDPLGATGIARYFLDSNGLDAKAAGSDNAGNSGHRGLPGSIHCVRTDEVADGVIAHRTKFAIGEPNEPSDGRPIWPMTGFEAPRSGLIPEGVVMRIEPSYVLPASLTPGARVIAQQLQRYGAICGDTASDGACSVKLERSVAWAALGVDGRSLQAIPWDAYEFVTAG
jgi:hypothetical protein